MEKNKGERIAKVIAQSGLCSRRDAEKLITERKVKVNGAIIDSPALNVSKDDEIFVSGKQIEQKSDVRLWLYHKPVGLVTTHKDELGRKTVFETIPKYLPRMVSVGRLDLNTEGLLLLTNDGGLARHLELPTTGLKRRYRVRVYGFDETKMIEKLAKGMTIEGIRYAPIICEVEKAEKRTANIWVTVTLSEGKNREIRKVFEHFGCKVSRLIRISYGVFELNDLAQNEIREVPRKVMLRVFDKELI
jgi:23S rRNA pseudouridine2605 synthase